MPCRGAAHAPRLLTAIVLLVSASVAARGQEPPPGAHAASAPASLLERLKLGGFVDLYFASNANHPASDANFYPGYGSSARRTGELAVNLAGFDLALPPEPVGFHLVAAAGTEMEFLKSGEPDGESTGRETLRHVYQATISYLAPLGAGLLVEAGLYPSHIGFESPLPRDNWAYTQAWAGNLTPSYQTGIKLAYPLSDALAAELHVVNGWQITADNNDRSSYGAKLTWTPARGSLALATWYGPELSGNDEDVRALLDLVATVKPTERLQLAFEGIAGRQERPRAAGGGSDDWTILAAWARMALGERTAIAVRAERVEDDAGAISGFAQALAEGTLTLELRPRPELALKLEGRYDRSDARVFPTDGEELARAQRLLVAAAILTF